MKKSEEKKLREYQYLACRDEKHHWSYVSMRSSEYQNGHLDRRDECLQCGTERLLVLDRRFKTVLRYYFYPKDYLMDIPLAPHLYREAYTRFILGWTD